MADERARRETFDNVADVYHEIRPGYPPALYSDLFKLLRERPLVLEVGPGTGQATRDLLAYGATVAAVEIGSFMAAKLRQVLASARLTVHQIGEEPASAWGFRKWWPPPRVRRHPPGPGREDRCAQGR